MEATDSLPLFPTFFSNFPSDFRQLRLSSAFADVAALQISIRR